MRVSECKRSAWFVAANLLGLLTAAGSENDKRLTTEERIEQSPQWKDGRFHNRQPLWTDMTRALLTMFSKEKNNVPSEPMPVCEDTARVLSREPEDGLRVTWFGHSSTLVEIDGRRVLIDPVWGPRTSPFAWAGPKRWQTPVLPLDSLPPLDAVLISHDHYDHLDRPTIEALRERVPHFVVPLGVGAELEAWGVERSRITELDWWESASVGSLKVYATPARHASGRGLFGRDKTLWSGYVLSGAYHRVYYSGDTGMMEAFDEIGERFGPFDLTLLEIGEYSQYWPDWHMGPEQAVAANKRVRGKVMLPVHWGLFSLAPHGWTEPIERAVAAANASGVTLATPMLGESISPSAKEPRLGRRWWPALPWRTAQEYPIVSTRDGKKPAKSRGGRKGRDSSDRRTLSENAAGTKPVLEKLRRELRDQAYEFDLLGQHVAADLASDIAARLDELLETKNREIGKAENRETKTAEGTISYKMSKL